MPTLKKPSTPNRPKLVNRGGAGLLAKKTGTMVPALGFEEQPQAPPINKIAEALEHLTVDIDSLTPDPVNARLHPERNMEAIKGSLSIYGQVKPLVVRKDGNIVVAGNGTLAAAKELGWTKIAITLVEMNDAEAAGYGLADNRTAELAKWDFEIVARLDKLVQEAGHSMVGWSMDELEVLRAADWVPPAIGEFDEDAHAGPLVMKMTQEQRDVIDRTAEYVRSTVSEEMTRSECIAYACNQWMESIHAEDSDK